MGVTAADMRVAPVAKSRSHGMWLGLGAFALLAAMQAWAISISVADRDMGHLQKIMYVHVPAAWNMMIAYFVVAIASLVGLAGLPSLPSRREKALPDIPP